MLWFVCLIGLLLPWRRTDFTCDLARGPSQLEEGCGRTTSAGKRGCLSSLRDKELHSASDRWTAGMCALLPETIGLQKMNPSCLMWEGRKAKGALGITDASNNLKNRNV
ncbi:unnamed protein product [Caretta caretta]